MDALADFIEQLAKHLQREETRADFALAGPAAG
jgi:hypothetical protein